MELANDILEKLNSIPKNIRVVAATKYVEALDMKKLLTLGINHFGENRVDSLLKKQEELIGEDIHWHFIGHLQTNKAKLILPKIEALHSLDSLKLAQIIEKERKEPLDCFVEININQEESKSGIPAEECENFLKEIMKYPKVHVVGFMCMTMKSCTPEEKKAQFQSLKNLMLKMNELLGMNMQELSMGMSDDYNEAIAAGATTIRLGRTLWDQQS